MNTAVLLVLAACAVIGALAALVGATLWAAFRSGARSDRAYMASRGCYCIAGIDGYHVASCPLADPADQGGA